MSAVRDRFNSNIGWVKWEEFEDLDDPQVPIELNLSIGYNSYEIAVWRTLIKRKIFRNIREFSKMLRKVSACHLQLPKPIKQVNPLIDRSNDAIGKPKATLKLQIFKFHAHRTSDTFGGSQLPWNDFSSFQQILLLLWKFMRRAYLFFIIYFLPVHASFKRVGNSAVFSDMRRAMLIEDVHFRFRIN